MFRHTHRGLLAVSIVLLLALTAALAVGCGGTKVDKQDVDDTGKETSTGQGLAWPTQYFDNQRTGRSPYNGPTTAQVKWTYEAGSTSRSSWVVIAADGSPSVGFTGKFVSLSPVDGSATWEFPTGGAEATTCRAVEGGTVYVSAGNSVYALSSNGRQQWAYDMGSRADDPTVGNDGTIYAGSSGGRLVSLSKDGKLQWEFMAPGDIRSPSIDKKGVLYCSAATLALYCLDGKGNKVWEFKPEGDLPQYEGLFEWANTLDIPSIGNDGTVYAGAFVTPGMTSTGQQIADYVVPQQAKIYAITPQGQKKWEYSRPDGPYAIHSPTIGTDGTLYAGTSCWKVVALDPNGKLLWEFDTGQEPTECPSVYSPPIGKDGLLYAATTNSRIFCITPQGTEKWRYDAANPWLPGPGGQAMMGGSNNFTPPAIAEDGTLYSLLAEGKVFAFVSSAGGK